MVRLLMIISLYSFPACSHMPVQLLQFRAFGPEKPILPKSTPECSFGDRIGIQDWLGSARSTSHNSRHSVAIPLGAIAAQNVGTIVQNQRLEIAKPITLQVSVEPG